MHYAEVKKIILTHYAAGKVPKCKECGSTRDLQIDHPNEDGKCERQIHGSGYNFYRYLIRAKFPQGYRVLCRKCNIIKSIIYHERCVRSLKHLL